jgi:TonB family protein
MKYALPSHCLSRALTAGAVSCLLLGLPHAAPAQAQAVGNDTLNQGKVYMQVEQMPQLPKANRKDTNQQAVVAAIQRACRHPADALRNRVQGTVQVSFTVNKQGEVRDIRIEQGLNPDLDEATVAAVKTLPLFRPGQQGGQPVAVRYPSLPIRWAIQ